MAERTNGKKRTININQTVYKELHRPQVQDGDLRFPVYAKTESYKGSDRDTQAEASAKYQARVKTHYNSANNIRRLFITHDTLYIDYYRSPGAPTLKLANNTKASLSVDMMDILPKVASFQSDFQAYLMEKNINPKAVGPDQYTIEGNLLGVVNQLYTCSNIEEIYFDWTYLFSSEIQQQLVNKQMTYLVGNNALVALLNGQQVCNRFINTDVWENWFKVSALHRDEYAKCVKEPQKFREKYPRLRVIAMVTNLKDVIEGSVRSHSILRELASNNTKTWLETNAELLNQSNSTIICSQILGIPDINTKFVTQESTYVFDLDFVKWIDIYKKSAEDHIRQVKYGANSSNDIQDTIDSEIEKRMIQIEQEVGQDKFKVILKGTVSNKFKVQELKSLFRSFTKNNRVRWAKIIGLPLD